MKKLIFISILSIGIVVLFSCKKDAPIDKTNVVQEVNFNDGSVLPPFDGVVTDAPSPRSSTYVYLDFEELSIGLLPFDTYASMGVYIYDGPAGTSGDVVVGGSPCGGARSLTTSPFTGPSILINFDKPVSNVSIDAGDGGPSDSDELTLTAYSAINAEGSIVGSATDFLAQGDPTGCLTLTVNGNMIRSIEITDVGEFDNGGGDIDYYPNSNYIDNLYFEQIMADIDIKPGSYPNSINCKNTKQNIPVAILSTDDFDALTVDHTTVYFEGAQEWHTEGGLMTRHEEDVNEDGLMDLVFHFKLAQTNLDCESTMGTLVGYTYDGIFLYGSDEILMK